MNVNSMIWSAVWLISVGFVVGAWLAWIWASLWVFLGVFGLAVLASILLFGAIDKYEQTRR